MRTLNTRLLVAAVLVTALLVASCGPINAVVATSRAKDSMYKAQLAKAHELKPGQRYVTSAQYQYQLALLCVDKSKQLQGFAKYQAAEEYSEEAAALAEKAILNMTEQERRLIRRQQIRSGKVFHKRK